MEPILLVFDFDGCLYPFTDDLISIMMRATGRSNRRLSGGEWEPDESESVGMQSYLTTGYAYRKVCELFNHSLEEGHYWHHQAVDMRLEPDLELNAALRSLPDNVHLMVLTHSSRCLLARKLPELGMEDIFTPHMRVGHEDYQLKLKKDSHLGFLVAKTQSEHATGLKFKPENIYMFEDTAENLLLPKDMGWKTVLVHHRSPKLIGVSEPYIDIYAYNPTPVLYSIRDKVLANQPQPMFNSHL